MSIEVNQLLKQYGEQKAVNHISFTINKGEIVGFLGPNGAGKSTTLKIIAGYLLPDQGSAKVCGIDVGVNPLAIKRKIGYLPESNPLYFEMYVKEYLQFIAGVHQLKNVTAQIQRVIELTGLALEQKKKISALSKGYKQRVGIAAALIHQPEVLILDEPTSGLDPNQIIEIRNLIKQEGQNKTVLFSSHILQEVQAICDRVIIINNGSIVANDTLVNLQKGKKETYTVAIQFQEKIADTLLNSLQNCDGMEMATANPIGSIIYKLHTLRPDLLRKELFELSVQHNLNIVSLQTEEQSLEEVFRALTSKL